MGIGDCTQNDTNPPCVFFFDKGKNWKEQNVKITGGGKKGWKLSTKPNTDVQIPACEYLLGNPPTPPIISFSFDDD